MSQQGAALQTYNNELVKCEYVPKFSVILGLFGRLSALDDLNFDGLWWDVLIKLMNEYTLKISRN